MNILIANDDGIRAEGIRRLARLASSIGKVTVVAPAHQCSGMSHHISFKKELLVRRIPDYLEGVEAYSITGTPADCVRVGIECIMKEKPDIVFSGINEGYNIAREILYSGTVGAAMEALNYGIPAIAFSHFKSPDYSAIESYFQRLVEELMSREISKNQIWNVNFPHCSADDIKGIQYDCYPADLLFYHDHFEMEVLSDRMMRINEFYTSKNQAEEGSDCAALLNNYIAVGTITSMV